MLRIFCGLIAALICWSNSFNAVAQTPTAESKFWVHVCNDTGAGNYAAFPDLCRLQDGRLLCAFYRGYGHISYPSIQHPKGGLIAACYSTDEGKTWTDPEVVLDSPIDDMGSMVTQLADGRILYLYYTYENRGNSAVPNIVARMGIFESADNGKTWSEPRFPFPDNVVGCSPVRILSNGTLLMPLYTSKAGELSSGAVSLSNDQGKTWSDVIMIPNGGRSLDAETDVIELKDGTLYAMQRPSSGNMAYSYSNDKGKTWSVSKDAGFPGHCPNLFRTKDDVILLGLREPKDASLPISLYPNSNAVTTLRMSRDECRTWSESILVDDVIGAYPSMVGLKDGSVLIAYYEEGAGSNIRAKKFRVTATGVEWLPLE